LEVSDKTPDDIIKHLLKRIQEFVKNAPQHDDMTIVCAKFV
jgi:serine phosphatase RsbU (regulator of sigma subunit)